MKFDTLLFVHIAADKNLRWIDDPRKYQVNGDIQYSYWNRIPRQQINSYAMGITRTHILHTNVFVNFDEEFIGPDGTIWYWYVVTDVPLERYIIAISDVHLPREYIENLVYTSNSFRLRRFIFFAGVFASAILVLLALFAKSWLPTFPFIPYFIWLFVGKIKVQDFEVFSNYSLT